MTFEDFDEISKEILKKVQGMRDTKGREYTKGDPDRFANFNMIAELTSQKRNSVWLTYFMKHVLSVISYVNNDQEFSDEKIEGRVVDLITYLLLFAGMVREDHKPITGQML